MTYPIERPRRRRWPRPLAVPVLGALLLSATVPAAADSLVLPAPALDRTGPVTLHYRLGTPATGTATVTVDWTDSYGREVAHRVVRRKLDGGTDIPFSIDLRRAVALRNELRVRCVIDPDGGGALAEGEAETSFIARPRERGWRDYQVIMWQNQTPARLAALARLGVTAGKVFGTPNPPDLAKAPEEIAPFLALNLRWYVENIATDFYAAYHRWQPHRPVNWLFDEAVRRYWRDPNSRAAFVRTPSLSDPQWLHRTARRLRDHVNAYKRFRPLFYNLADEAGIADLAAAWDFDFSPASLAGMRVWLKEQYGSLAALNREWGTSFANWDVVMPLTTDEALRRTDGNFAAWEDFKAWMDVAFARAVRAGTDAVHAADPEARSGLEGAQMPGWGGYDYALLARAVDTMEIYDHGDSVAIARSLNPRLVILNTTSLASESDVRAVWHYLLEGARGLILWDENHAFVDADGAPTERGRQLAQLVGELRLGLAKQLLYATRQQSPVAILYSQASYRLQWLLDRKSEGGDWTKRGSEGEWNGDNAVRAATRRAVSMLTHLGLEPRFLTRAGVDGGILRRGIHVLILPHTIALSTEEAAELRAFIAGGGLVIADVAPGRFDIHGREQRRRPLDDLAGPGGRLVLMPEMRQPAASGDAERLAAMTRVLGMAGVGAPIRLDAAAGAPIADVQVFRWHTGDVTLLALQRDPPPKGAVANEDVILKLPRPMYIYDLRRPGQPVRSDVAKLRLDAVAPAILALAPVPLPALKLQGPSRAWPGERVAFRVAASPGDGASADRIVHIEVISPSGAVAHYSGNREMRGRTTLWHLPLALNDPVGRWTVRLTDVLTGQAISHTLLVAGEEHPAQ